MPRRLLMLLALIASLAVVACSSTPQAPALTDPKEILVQSVASLQNIKTVQIRGTFGGSINAAEMGNFDLSTVTLNAVIDVPGKKIRLTVDAPTLMGTTLDLISVDQVAYMKLTGPFSALIGADATGKYTQFPAGSGVVPEDATDPLKAIAEVRKSVDELPRPPEKLADERCGDADCYHVRITLTAEDLGEISDGGVGSVLFDIWSRKNDLRPAKMTFAVDAGAQGTVNGTFDLTYDQAVDISAPPADQIAG